jgi:hypothetical protein
MKFFEDGKSAKGGSDQDDEEDFGEASGRSNGGPRKKIRGPFWRIFGCVENRIEIVRKGIRQCRERRRFWEEDRQKNGLKKTHSVVRS